MRDYQSIKNNPYHLEHGLWMQTLWQIRRYDTLKEDYEARIESRMSPGTDGASGGKTNRTGDPTGVKAMRLVDISEQITAIDKAKLVVPDEYMDAVWNNIQYHSRYPMYADEKTYRRWKARFVYEVARNMGWI